MKLLAVSLAPGASNARRRKPCACRRPCAPRLSLPGRTWNLACGLRRRRPMSKMRATVFAGKGKVELRQVELPSPGPGEALVRMTLTTICGTDVHIRKGEYPVKEGLTIGHELVGRIEALGPGVVGYSPGERVIVGAITPCGQCRACLAGDGAQCSHGGEGFEAIGGWRFGNTIDGCQAEYVRVPSAQANLAKIPRELSDEDVLLCPDIMSTGFSAAERGRVKIGDAVAVFAQGPIGLCATAGARLCGASLVIAVDSVPRRLDMSKRMGADVTLNFAECDVVAEIRRLTGGGVDVAIEALGRQATFENALRSLRPGGTLSSLGVYSGHLTMPLDAIAAGLADQSILTTLCPGGKERMRRLMDVVRAKRFPFRELVTHTFALDRIVEAYDLFAEQGDGVLKVAIKP
jgi:alcohol dehydrogenase